MSSADLCASVQALKQSVQNLCDAGVRKTTFYPLIAHSLKCTSGKPRQIRRALAFAHLLDHVELVVLPIEKLGGSILGMWPVVDEPPYDEQLREAFGVIEAHIGADSPSHKRRARALMARDHYDTNISFSSMQKIIKAVQGAYEGSDAINAQAIASTLEAHFVFDYGDDVMRTIEALPWAVANHLHLNYGSIITEGYGALLERINGLLTCAAQHDEAEKVEFYTAASLSIEAAIRYIRRYADAYQCAAAAEADAVRTAELRGIADRLSTVSTQGASSFREAMQLMWITHIIANTALGSALSFARFDQYMYPFYSMDREKGIISDDEVRELIAHMILKVNEPKMRTVQSLALGGTTPDGGDASNELTRLILEAAREVAMPYPNLSLRVASELTPEWAYDEAIATIQRGFGMPMLVNDDVWVANFMRLGYPAEYAREYYNMGCVEMMIQNRQAHWCYAQGSPVHYPNLLDGILSDCCNGLLRLDTFDALMAEFVHRIGVHVSAMGTEAAREAVEKLRADAYDPFASALLIDCLNRGLDMYHGGVELPAQVAVGGMGLATATDALSAIKLLVYERKEIGLRELVEAVHSNFAGQEALRLKLSNAAPHYGNDDDAADDIAVSLFNTATAAVHALNIDPARDRFVNSYFSYTSHVSTGEISAATPDGRRAGEPFSDGLGPVQGKDTEGPTRLLNSLLKLDYRYLTGACATNCKISPSLFGTASGTQSLKHLIKAYLASGGPQIQINFVRQQDLIDAQRDPQAHREIVVRIAGFCEYFVNLDYRQQNEIIKRTAHDGL